jgi:long-chain-alcohol oxidase
VVLVNVVLWILSTKVGTLALCGRLCISGGKFPYVRKFADMPVERREQALTQWNRTRWLFPLKITFVVVKILSHYAFYTTVCSHIYVLEEFCLQQSNQQSRLSRLFPLVLYYSNKTNRVNR